ncbi:MAG: nitrate reductase [Pseudomonadota bacterium]
MHSKDTTCPYCGVGCGVTAQTDGRRLIAVEGNSRHPANRGRLCVKGANLAATMVNDGRLLRPVVDGREVDWRTATDEVAARLRAVVDVNGADAVAFYLSGQLLTEDYYVANKLIKGYIGTANVDTNSRLCMASAVAAHKRAFGEDVVPCDYSDLESADLIILCGSNTAWAHPIVYQRIVAAREARGTRVVVIDPRRTTTCDIADQHLAIRPGTDAALFNGLLAYVAANGALDHDFVERHTEGFAAARAANRLSPEAVATLTDLDLHQVLSFYAAFADTQATVTLFSQGVNQAANGTDRANAIINCHLATGRIGIAGAGPFSITGQPNAMGGREVGGLANQLAAHMDFDETCWTTVSNFWGAPNLARQPGLKAVDMFDAIHDGRIKALWVMGTNPAVSLPNTPKVRAALARCETVIVSDCVAQTDTTAFADVLLPAQGWGEKDGTVTNSERRISRQRRLLPAVGEARPDWQIICDVAISMGFADAFAFTAAHEIFAEHVDLSATNKATNRLFDLSFLKGLSARDYADLEPVSWPPQERPYAQRLFSTPSGRARFVPTAHREALQQPCPAYPLILNSGRFRDQWHTMTRTGSAAKLFLHSCEPTLQIHPRDAASRNIINGDLVAVRSAVGEVRLIADVCDNVRAGNVFAPIHWNDRFASMAVVGSLFESAADPISGQPESKHAAVQCRAIKHLTWARLLYPAELDLDRLNGCVALRYWAVSPGQDRAAFQYEFALANSEAMAELIELGDALCFQAGSQLRLLGEHSGRPWLLFTDDQRERLPPFSHLQHQLDADVPDWQKLSVRSVVRRDQSPVVCTCFEVTRSRIEQAILAGHDDLPALGRELKCGTNCGSCVPELNELLARLAVPAAVAAR